VKYNIEIISQLFQRFISHVATSKTEIKIISAAEGVLKLFQNYFSDIEHCWKIFVSCNNPISGKFPRSGMKIISVGRRRRLK